MNQQNLNGSGTTAKLEKREDKSKSKSAETIKNAIEVFDYASSNGGITLNSTQSNAVLLLLQNYLEIVKKLDGIWR